MPNTPEALDLPFDEAIEFFRGKANVDTETWRDVWGAAHSRSFSVAGAAGDALLSDFRREIDKAISEGTTLEEFRSAFDDIVNKHGWDYRGERNWRTRVIFQTNIRTAYAAGRYAQLTLPDTIAAFPFWQYQHSGSVHPRLDHLSWDGKVWRADNPVWSRIYPPNGFGCGCFVVPASAADLARQGKSGPDSVPNLDSLDDTARGVDPSFDYNPGQAWLSSGRPGERLATAAMIETFEKRALAGEIPINTTVAIAPLDASLITALDLDEGTHARVSAQTLREHIPKRPISAFDYSRFATEALAGTIHVGANGGLSSIVEFEGRSYVVGFKRTRHGELLVTTVHRVNARKKRKIEAQDVLER